MRDTHISVSQSFIHKRGRMSSGLAIRSVQDYRTDSLREAVGNAVRSLIESPEECLAYPPENAQESSHGIVREMPENCAGKATGNLSRKR